MQHHATARGLAEYRDAVRIAAERADGVAHPLERRDRIAQPAVRPATRRSRVEESERTEPVVAGHEHDVLLETEARAVVDRLRRGAHRERAAREPHEHGPV